MNVAYIEEQSFIYGPGCRFVLWTQGCSIRCKGCWNSDMWDFSPKMLISVDDLVLKVRNILNNIEGVTILGGEPLDQFEEVKNFVVKCRDLNLTTMLFTGYEMEEIENKGFKSILNYLDILITGRYDEKKRTLNHQWIGSTNQKIIFLTDIYKFYEIRNGNYIEININEDGSLTYLGFPEPLF